MTLSTTSPGDEREAFKLDPLEQIIDAFVEDYEMLGEDEQGRDGYYSPNERERILIKDAIMGLLADADWDEHWGKHCEEIAASRASSSTVQQVGAEWISVEDRLPGEQGCDSEEVLCFLNGHCGMTDFEARNGGGWGIRLGYFDAERQCFRVHGRPDDFVTHWQPLPPPPASSPKSEQGDQQ